MFNANDPTSSTPSVILLLTLKANYDIDSPSSELSAHDFLGRMECELAEIVSNRPFTKALSGTKHKNHGEITVSCDEVDDGAKENVLFHLSAKKLDKKDFFGKSDPFLNIYRISEDGTRQLAHRTEVIKKELNPVWNPFEVNVKMLCSNDYKRPILIECFDYDWDGGYLLQLINDKKRAKKGDKYKNSGTLEFNGLNWTLPLPLISLRPTVLFTNPHHFTVSVLLNRIIAPGCRIQRVAPFGPLLMELRAVIDICQHYNNSKQFDAFGFGAILPPQTCVSPIFSLNFDANPSVVGVRGVMESYRFALSRVKLYGPTNFKPVIQEVAKKASRISNKTDGSRYQVLLIITDGAISDMAATKQAIIAASSLPLSIIIVGVGNDEFENMNELDSDTHLLTHAGRTAQRDIVQVQQYGYPPYGGVQLPPTALPPQPYPSQQPYPPQTYQYQQQYPGYAPAGAPPYPTPLPHHAILQQRAPSAPTAPPVDLGDIQPSWKS
ncbi:C2 domain protein [Teladorsagia circumcincta]|uniref:C2 domain protein n=3 Tax=Teladorsagia circumcincta TaxID=45464 RepID=A0A2G9TWV7_TELCI|nr:C2 domain protein [Teladorsagia circumcincta]